MIDVQKYRRIAADEAAMDGHSNGDATANGRKLRLLSAQHLDGRTSAAKAYAALLTDIVADLGKDLSAIELTMAEAYCGAAIVVRHLNAQRLRGEEIDLTEYSQMASTMVRLGTRLGLQRRAKEIEPTLGDLLRDFQPDDAVGHDVMPEEDRHDAASKN